MDGLTIMRLHPLQVLLPAHVLAVHFANVRYKEGVFVTRLTDLVIDVGDTLIHSIADQRSPIFSKGAVSRRDAQAFAAMDLSIVCFCGIDGQWCHALACRQVLQAR